MRCNVPGFISPRALEWCSRAAEAVPASARAHYLECRPGWDERVDLLSFFGSTDAYRDYDHAVRPIAVPNSSWERNLSLLREWATPGSTLFDAPCMWLEYDAPSTFDATRLEASPSVALEPDYHRRHVESPPGLSPIATRLTSAALSVLLPSEALQATRRVVERCFASLPKQGAVGYVSVMTARRPVVTKLYVILPRETVVPFLRTMTWPGDLRHAAELLAQFYPPTISTAYLDLTISTRVEARLGVAASQFHRRELARSEAEAWPPIPAAISAQAPDLAAWTGITRAVVAGRKAQIQRWLDLKAVLDEGQVRHKAYLGFAPSLSPPFE